MLLQTKCGPMSWYVCNLDNIDTLKKRTNPNSAIKKSRLKVLYNQPCVENGHPWPKTGRGTWYYIFDSWRVMFPISINSSSPQLSYALSLSAHVVFNKQPLVGFYPTLAS